MAKLAVELGRLILHLLRSQAGMKPLETRRDCVNDRRPELETMSVPDIFTNEIHSSWLKVDILSLNHSHCIRDLGALEPLWHLWLSTPRRSGTARLRGQCLGTNGFGFSHKLVGKILDL